FDNQVAILRMPDRKKRDAALEQSRFELEQPTIDATNSQSSPLSWLTNKSPKSLAGRTVGAELLQQFNSDLPEVINFNDHLQLHCAFVEIGIALAAYRADHGEYPPRLDELSPKYLAQLPRDPYSEHNALRYRRVSSGYVLYSVGPNGIDEQGGESENF